MTQSGYSFTPGKYEKTVQTDVVPEQEKSNARILASEEKFLQEMADRDDALVEKTRSEWESLSNLSSTFGNWLKEKAEKDKKEKLQAGAALAIKIPASAEDISALVAQEDGLKDSHLKINEIADRIEEETGSFELAEQFRNLSGWEQYAYVKASLTRAAGNYQDFKNEHRANTTITRKDGTVINYENANESERAGLDAKIRHKFSEQFIGVNEKLLAATVAPEVKKVDETEISEARKENNAKAKKFKIQKELDDIEIGISGDPAEAVKYANFWVENNKGNYGGRTGARLAFKDKVVTLVDNGDLPLYVAQGLIRQTFYHEGDKKDVTLLKFKEFAGIEDELIAANTNYLSKKKDDEKFVIESNAAAIKKELEDSGTVMSIEQKKDYLKKRRAQYPDQPLNADELSFLYGYRDDETMRQELLIKVERFGGITETDLKHASPSLRLEMKNAGHLIPEAGAQITNLNQVPQAEKKRLDDLVSNSAKSTGTLEAKNLQYYALLDASEDIYINAYNDAIKAGVDPSTAHAQAFTAVNTLHSNSQWVDANSEFKGTTRDNEYETKLVNAKRQLDPENAGYATKLLETPQEQKDELIKWAAEGGKGQVPYYYRAICKGTNVLPRDLAWKQASILGYPGQFDENEIKEFKIPKSMITLFLNNNPTKNGYKRFSIDVETIENEDNDEEVHPYEENEDYD